MLHGFLTANRGEILGRSRAKLAGRHIPTPTASELERGLPLFLDQIITILRAGEREGDGEGGGDRGAEHHKVSVSAGVHGGDLLRMGLTVGQVVQDYGSICQSVTELAGELEVSITTDEFQTFNRCLDEAIAEAVTTFVQQRDQAIGETGQPHLAFLAHEMRNLLSTSMLTFATLMKGSVGIQGSTGALLGRSLQRMRALIDRTLVEVRLEAGNQRPTRVLISQLIEEVEIVATIEAQDRDVQLSVDSGPSDVAVEADQHILASVLANLVQNAFKFTRSGGHVRVRARATSDRVLIEVEDQCGGLPPGQAEDLFKPFEQRGHDKTGMGLGLAICLKGVRVSGGEIHVEDHPGQGCVFTVDLPRAAPEPSQL